MCAASMSLQKSRLPQLCVHLLEKLQCLLRPCAKFQEPTASPSMSRRPPDTMNERSHDHSENGCLKRYCCNLGRRAGGGGRPSGRTCPEWSGPVRTTTTLQGIGPVFLTGVLPSSRISPSRLPSSSSMQNPCNTQGRQGQLDLPRRVPTLLSKTQSGTPDQRGPCSGVWP